MKYFIRNICCILLLLITQQAMANKKIHVQFSQKEYAPILKADGNLIQVTFPGSALLQEIFSAYKFKFFEKEFPTVYKETHYLAASLDLAYILDTDNGTNLLFEQLKRLGTTIIKELVYVDDPIPLNTSNDFDLFTSTAVAPTGFAFKASNPLNLVNVGEAWDITIGSSSVIVGVLDRGLGFTPVKNHEDIVNKIALNHSPLTDTNYHGLNVASIIAAETNNNKGIAGIAYNTRLYTNSPGENYILTAAQNGAKVINCSWVNSNCNFYQPNQDIITLVHDVYKAVIVAASGNGVNGNSCFYTTGNGNSYCYPASYKYVISVTSVAAHFDQGVLTAGKKSNWKDRADYILGETYYNHTRNDKVDLAAPGYHVAAAHLTYNNTTSLYQDRYVFTSGTSFAAPMVTGAAALMLAVNPALNPEDVEAILKCTARDLYEIPDNVKYLNILGAGRLDVGKAVQIAQTWVPGTAPLQQDLQKIFVGLKY
jgi:subtilisin family serine protease